MKEPTVIFEDENILVADKPAGLAVHGEGSDPAGTLVEWFLSREPEARGVGEERTQTDGEMIERSGVVHRLDRETSGVILLAKTQVAFDYFKAEFKARRVKKEYRALVYGKMNERWGTINRKIGRSASDWRRRSAERGARGMLRDAVTDWQCLMTGEYEGEPFSSLKLEPQTGRMHQLRVHLKAISRPIVGDSVYAGSKSATSNNLGLDRLALHALSLSVTMLDGRSETFSSPYPETLATAEALIAPA
jgi:23S rRNA pseudouridine1911/1915/1917 synthase